MATVAYAGSDLLALQGNCKKDSDGYKEEFLLQYRHYQALLDIFRLKPSKESKEFGDLVSFISQVCKCYPEDTVGFAEQVMALLDAHYSELDSVLRRTLVQGLILLHNRSQLDALTVLPLFFRLFRCQDKQLRHMLFKHIVSDIKNANKKHRNERLNRSLQNFMYSVIGDDNEAAAKKSLAVCTELWRRHVWRDARTVNVIASAAFHKSPRIMLAVMKFFLGQDQGQEPGSDDEDGKADEDTYKPAMPTNQEYYNTTKKGTVRSKKKKMHKLKRVVATVKKAARRGAESHTESFAALHLLHDPQSFSERLFSRLQASAERFETRMAIMGVVSRVIGVHKLLVLNFYPYLQKYIAPHQRDVTVVLAALAMACHELVPPESLTPVLKQLVDQFVNDRARPEVMTIGLKTAREMCLRSPLIMNEDLLQDLALYKKYRDKQVSSAARGLIGLFRDLNPTLLTKKDRGRGADLESKPMAYGEVNVQDRVQGADLLEQAEAMGQASEDDEVRIDSSESEDDEPAGGPGEMSMSGEGEDEDDDGESEGEEEDGDSEYMSSDDDDEEGEEMEEAGEEKKGRKRKGEEEEEEEVAEEQPVKKKQKLQSQPESLSALKKRLAAFKADKAAKLAADLAEAARARAESVGPTVPIESERFLTEEDFDRIRRLKHKALVEAAMSKHGLKPGSSKAKQRRALQVAEEEAEEALSLQRQKGNATEQKIDAEDLRGRHKYRKDKDERIASIMEGREGRGKFGAAAGKKKNKTGGLTEREKQRTKSMPIAARIDQLKKRSLTSRIKKSFVKNYKGKTARHE